MSIKGDKRYIEVNVDFKRKKDRKIPRHFQEATHNSWMLLSSLLPKNVILLNCVVLASGGISEFLDTQMKSLEWWVKDGWKLLKTLLIIYTSKFHRFNWFGITIGKYTWKNPCNGYFSPSMLHHDNMAQNFLIVPIYIHHNIPSVVVVVVSVLLDIITIQSFNIAAKSG